MEIWSDFQYDSLRKPIIKVFRAAYCSHDPGFCLLYKQLGPGFRLQSCLHLQDFQYFYFCLMKEGWALKVAQQFGIWWLVAYKTVVYKNIKCKPKKHVIMREFDHGNGKGKGVFYLKCYYIAIYWFSQTEEYKMQHLK